MTNGSGSLAWQSRHATGIPSIDSHHQGLFKILRMLDEDAPRGLAGPELVAIIGFLEQCVLAHFEDENEFMWRHDYAGISAHIRDHDRLIAHLGQMKERHARGDTLVRQDVVPVLTAWLMNHIQRHDQPLGEFMADQFRG
jgi:hemerythrin-like metal-binding protein